MEQTSYLLWPQVRKTRRKKMSDWSLRHHPSTFASLTRHLRRCMRMPFFLPPLVAVSFRGSGSASASRKEEAKHAGVVFRFYEKLFDRVTWLPNVIWPVIRKMLFKRRFFQYSNRAQEMCFFILPVDPSHVFQHAFSREDASTYFTQRIRTEEFGVSVILLEKIRGWGRG